ncbi:hypothetical protein ABENE_05475 [Asticcacaulis benevestitus DSM 16100 = ATCC BAA-896]|uniref:Uncharacterized protein n=2 Tax=Asticcacaulis TaxID=76890 RepID=V4PZG8_9CAUL|nr:hypothetical protein ABENE_05475 [Asticcacaulis benevestitus DSM 16100 = ATCC BAA-896]
MVTNKLLTNAQVAQETICTYNAVIEKRGCIVQQLNSPGSKVTSAAIAVALTFFGNAHTTMAQEAPCYVSDFRVSGNVKWSKVTQNVVEPPFNLSFEQSDKVTLWYFNRAKDQHGQWWGSISEDGKVSLHINFTNGSPIDGDHFAAVLSLRDMDGEIVRDTSGEPAVVEFGAGVDAKGWCHARGQNYKCYKRTLSFDITLDPETAKSVFFVEQRHGFNDKVDDSIFWDDVMSIAECVAAQ